MLLWLRAADRKVLLLPVGLLAISTTVSAVLYTTGQNWFWSVLTSNYFGWSYLGIVGVVLAFLADILLNRGRVTWSLVDALSAGTSTVC